MFPQTSELCTRTGVVIMIARTYLCFFLSLTITEKLLSLGSSLGNHHRLLMLGSELSSSGFNTERAFSSFAVFSGGAERPHAGHCACWGRLCLWGWDTAAWPLSHCCESRRRAPELHCCPLILLYIVMHIQVWLKGMRIWTLTNLRPHLAPLLANKYIIKAFNMFLYSSWDSTLSSVRQQHLFCGISK